MRVIGLTGGIGTGKSTVAGFLAELGAAVINLDEVGHRVLEKGGAARERVIGEFGEGILDGDGNIDREKVAAIVFNDPAALRRLNAITHPAIDDAVGKQLEEYRRSGAAVVVLEAAAMLEAGKTLGVDEILITTAPESTVLARLSRLLGFSHKDVKARIRSQLTDEERLKHADVIINTDCPLEELKAKVAAEWRQLQARI